MVEKLKVNFPYTSNDGRHGRHAFKGGRGKPLPYNAVFYSSFPQQFLYFLPLPQGQGSFLPTFSPLFL